MRSEWRDLRFRGQRMPGILQFCRGGDSRRTKSRGGWPIQAICWLEWGERVVIPGRPGKVGRLGDATAAESALSEPSTTRESNGGPTFLFDPQPASTNP
jgi:hypothetical protein